MRRMFCVVCCILSLAAPLFSQTERNEPLTPMAVSHLYQHPVVVTGPYRQAWYDALLRQFNPDDLDWGHWLEQRREAFLEQTAANPYFKYCLVTTSLLILLAIALAKALIDMSRIKWLAQERHEVLLEHDRCSRRAAHEAIRKYNTHIEKCNRAIEAELGRQHDMNGTAAAADAQGDSAEALAEAADLRRERDALAGRLEQKSAIVGQIAARLSGLSVKVNGTAGSQEPADGESRQADLVKQNNDLREQLYRECERNKRLKGM